MSAKRKTGKSTQLATVQLGQLQLAPNVSSASPVTGVPCSSADTHRHERLLGDFDFATASGGSSSSSLGTKVRSPCDAIATMESQPLTGGSQSPGDPFFAPKVYPFADLSTSRQSFHHPAPASKDDRQNTTPAAVKVYPPGNSAGGSGSPGRSSHVRALTSSSSRPTKRLMTTKPEESLRQARGHSDTLIKAQRHVITPKEAHSAFQVVLGYCQQQQEGFLDQQDGMSLGRLSERLRCSCE